MEYKILKSETPISEKQLAKMGTDGWMLISVIEWEGEYYWYFGKMTFDTVDITQ